MRILHILTSPRAEGTPRLVLDWLSELQYEQHVVFLNSEPVDLLNTFNTACKNVYLFNHQRSKGLKKIYSIIFSVYKISLLTKPNIVISWNQGYSHWIILGAKLGKAKKTIVHGGCDPTFDTGIKPLIYSWIVHWPLYLMKTKLICASAYIAKRFRTIPLLPKNNIYWVHNCFRYNNYLKPLHYQIINRKIVIMVGNIEPAKNQIFLLKIWPKVLTVHPDAQLWFIGHGSQLNYLQQYAKDIRVNDNVKFWGYSNNVAPILWQANVFAFPSLNEGFGTVLLEALAAGLHIVASDIPACREVLENGKWGFLIDIEQPDLWIKTIIELLQHAPIDLNTKIYQQRLQYIFKFTPSAMINCYISIAYGKSNFNTEYF